MSLVIVALLLASPPPPPPPLTPPPPPPPIVDAPPLIPAPQVAQTPRVYVRLLKVPEGSELYDATRAVALCRAPCGVWLDSDPEHQYQLQGDFRASNAFGLSDFGPGAGVDVDFVPRDEAVFAIGLALTIAGGVGVVAGAVSAVVWLYISLIVALFGGPGLVLLEFLYFAAVAVAVGVPGVAVGVPLLIKSRPLLDVREARPAGELPAAR